MEWIKVLFLSSNPSTAKKTRPVETIPGMRGGEDKGD
jgi:hypothetical protein